MNTIRIDLERPISPIDRHIFGGFLEHLGRAVYGGVFEPGSPLADEQGCRKDVLHQLRRLKFSNVRYPGGNFVSGYNWRDGVGPIEARPARAELAWHTVETNHFGTNEFIEFCRKLDTAPYFVVNCGDGDMREARDWVEYCNGTTDTTLVKLRRSHGFDAPHRIKYWGIGNEVDGHWQIGFKTAQEYARAFTEFGKVMKWVDPDIKLIASMVSDWKIDIVERAQLLLEQAGNLVDYLAIHWYVNRDEDFPRYMTLSELFEERLSAYEGLVRILKLDNVIKRDLWIAVDEWNVWFAADDEERRRAERYTLADALMVAMQLNAFIRHARSVKLANLAQIVNVIAPIYTNPQGLFRQSIFYPFELYSQNCGTTALDVFWQGETFSAGDSSGLRVLDVTATLDAARQQLAVFVVNRSLQPLETTIALTTGQFAGPVTAKVVNGPDVTTINSFETPDAVATRETALTAQGRAWTYIFEPHSVTGLICAVS